MEPYKDGQVVDVQAHDDHMGYSARLGTLFQLATTAQHLLATATASAVPHLSTHRSSSHRIAFVFTPDFERLAHEPSDDDFEFYAYILDSHARSLPSGHVGERARFV